MSVKFVTFQLKRTEIIKSTTFQRLAFFHWKGNLSLNQEIFLKMEILYNFWRTKFSQSNNALHIDIVHCIASLLLLWLLEYLDRGCAGCDSDKLHNIYQVRSPVSILQLNLIQDFIILFAYLVIYEYANLLVVFGW